MKNDTKIEEELTCRFQTDMRNLTNFDLSTLKANGLLTTKVYVRAKKVQRSYLS